VPNSFFNTIVEPKIFQLLIKYHSGMALCRPDSSCSICGCNLDSFGDHLIQCSHSGQRIMKHDALVRNLYGYLGKGKIAHITEQSVDKDRMGDLVLLDFDQGRDLYVDLSIVSSL
jgi:hypothetical protein